MNKTSLIYLFSFIIHVTYVIATQYKKSLNTVMFIRYIFKYTQDQVSHQFCTMLLIVFFLMCGTVHVVISQIYLYELNGRGHFLVLLYPHFLKKVRVYCCKPFLSVRPSVRPSVRKKSLSLELRLHFKDLRNDTLGSHLVCLVDAQ